MITLWRRELTRLSRSSGTPWFLLAYLGFGLVAAQATIKLMTDMPQFLATAGLLEPAALSVLAALQMVFLLLAAGYIAGDIAAHDLERGEQEQILATGRSRFGLLVTKYAAAMTWIGLLWLLYLPIYSLLPRLGSFSLHLLAKLALVQLAPVAAAAALGILVAHVARSRRAAANVTVGVVLFALLGSYLLGSLITYAVQGGQAGVFFGGPVAFKGGPPPMQGAVPAGMGIPVDSGYLPTFTKRAMLLSTLSPAAGLLSVLDMPSNPPVMPGMPVYFMPLGQMIETRHPLWEVQVVGYGGLAVLLLLSTYAVTAWPGRRFWRRRYKVKADAPPILSATTAATGSETP